MGQGIKAFLLSALVFPGLGQLYNQDRKKGVLLVLLANLLLGILLLLGVTLLAGEYYETSYPAPLTWEIFRQLVLNVLGRPLFLVPFSLLVGVWAFAAVDAGRRAGRRPPEE